MPVVEFTSIVFLISGLAGFLGALTGLGGGVVITPALTLLLGVNLRYAIGASLVSVIATSSGAAVAYVREGYSNVRIGMLLEIGTSLGAVIGAALAGYVPTGALAIVFGLVLLHSAWQSNTKLDPNAEPAPTVDPLSTRLRLHGVYPSPTDLLSCAENQSRDGRHVRSGPAIGATGDRFGSAQGDRNGSGDGASVQGLHHHK